MRAETVHALLLMGILVGLAFSVFAAYETTHPAVQGVCSPNSFVSCQKIDTSGHTTTLGIEDWLWGIGGFVVLLAFDIPLYRTWKREWLLAVTALSALGAILSVYFAYVELAIIQGLCPVCLSAYLCNVVVLGCAVYLMRLSASERRAAARSATDAGA
ncbi:MAG: vitamin K epoxide reductase family protein [Thermoplasmata archaeon]|nr:vitamin K epoxide reductase family protein [Thermoplasmata archaeon]